MNFDFELELLNVVQQRITVKLSKDRNLGDNPRFQQAMNSIAGASEMIRDSYYNQTGSLSHPDGLYT